MQRFHDDRIDEIKFVTKFEPHKEKFFLEMPTIEWYRHLSARRNYKADTTDG